MTAVPGTITRLNKNQRNHSNENLSTDCTKLLTLDTMNEETDYHYHDKINSTTSSRVKTYARAANLEIQRTRTRTLTGKATMTTRRPRTLTIASAIGNSYNDEKNNNNSSSCVGQILEKRTHENGATSKVPHVKCLQPVDLERQARRTMCEVTVAQSNSFR